jgi:broad specificity phosphatase PhoE
MTTPRVFIIRHGETTWSLSGRHTGATDIPLTSSGEQRIRATGRALVGPDRLIVPRNLAHVYVSPRRRAQRTLELLNLRLPLPWVDEDGDGEDIKGQQQHDCGARVEVSESVREWEYGDYEGITSKEIAEQRKASGEEAWDIWRDGCPGGEYVELCFPSNRPIRPNAPSKNPKILRSNGPLSNKMKTAKLTLHSSQIPRRHHRPLRRRHRRHPPPLPPTRHRQAQRQRGRALRRANRSPRPLLASVRGTLDRQEYRRQPEFDPRSRRSGDAELRAS